MTIMIIVAFTLANFSFRHTYQIPTQLIRAKLLTNLIIHN